MRTFVSVAPSAEVRHAIDDLQQVLAERVREAGVSGRVLAWSLVGKMHLTLRFLGETRDDQLRQLEQMLDSVATRHTPFALGLQGIGAFPDWRRPGVVWLGIERSSALFALQADVEAAVQEANFAAETRSYKAHLTLARTSRQARPEELRRLGEVLRDVAREEAIAGWTQSFRVTSVELMRSDLLPAGARYSVLSSVELCRGNGD